MAERTREEWARLSKEVLDDARELCDAAVQNWTVVKSGRRYQVLEGGVVVQSNNSIWKIRTWLTENIETPKYPNYKPTEGEPALAKNLPSTFATAIYENAIASGRTKQRFDDGRIKNHYANLTVPKHVKDANDYRLTDTERSEIKSAFMAKLSDGWEKLEATVKPPIQVYGDTGFNPAPNFVLCDAEGDVLKESSSPWEALNWYKRVVLKE